MKVIIAGSRTITDMAVVREAIEKSGFEITEVVSGCADGVDSVGMEWALKNDVKLKLFPAKWVDYGKRAGPIRNQDMADFAEALVAVWDGESRGTADMIRKMEAAGKPVYVHRTDHEE